MSEQRLTQIAELQREKVTGAQATIDADYANLRDGKYFTYASHFDILAGASTKFTFLTPATGHIYLRPAYISPSADKLTFNAYEGSSGNSGGSAITPMNRNRNSLVASSMVCKSGVTVTANGTKLTEAYLAGSTGVGQSRSGFALSLSQEWVLKPETLYTYEFINGSTATNTVFVEFQWFELA
jgi:hypothetical protein